jgi:hypothetical protein
MDQSTATMLDAIDKRMAKLKEIRAMIVEEFGQNGTAPRHRGAKGSDRRKRRSSIQGALSGRKTQIHNWLKQNGPASRSEIIKGTGLPGGTVGGYLSSEKGLFESRDGKWHAR